MLPAKGNGGQCPPYMGKWDAAGVFCKAASPLLDGGGLFLCLTAFRVNHNLFIDYTDEN
jgi:hypothetical protein